MTTTSDDNASDESQPRAGLTLQGITKRFGNLVANDSVDLEIRPGEIHCLLGENGAGKSTLMNMIYGLFPPDDGTIQVDGVPQQFDNPKQAIGAGIGMVHQHFMLVDVFTVAENMILGREPGAVGTLSLRRARRRVRERSQRHGLQVDPDAVVEHLPVGVQQRVEILKALASDATYLIFDEPTAVLTPQEIDELMRVMRELRDDGKAIVFITHKLAEVTEVADRITVMRRGAVAGQADPTQPAAELAEMMVGHEVGSVLAKHAGDIGEVRLTMDDLTVLGASGAVVVDGLDMEVAAGEIVCIAGVQGNGQSELAEALIGTIGTSSGRISIDGTPVAALSPKGRIAAGLGYVPEDRQAEGFVGSYTVAENLVLNSYDRPPFAHRTGLNLGEIRQAATDRVSEFDIRTQSIDTEVAALSGGNQQKVVLAREMSRQLSVLIASQPTRGVDVGAIEFLHNRLIAERDRGTAVLIISTELDEVSALADRIAVMYRGKIVGVVAQDTSHEVLGLMMAGVGMEQAMASAQTVTAEAEGVIT